MAQDFNSTLNLPKTDFPMRAGLPKREPDMLKKWEALDVYHEMLKKNEGKPRYSLHDGPPFSNGAIHMGHALNKALKDFICHIFIIHIFLLTAERLCSSILISPNRPFDPLIHASHRYAYLGSSSFLFFDQF